MILRIIFTTFVVLIFLYVFWRRLKEDYTQNQIFTCGFYILLGLVIGSIIADAFAPLWFFWLSFSGAVAGMLLGVYRFKLRIFEVLEASVIGALVLLSATYTFDWITTKNIFSALGALAVVILMIFYALLNKHYKRFTWYKSGKVGFSGMMTLGIFFLIRTIIAILLPHMLSFVGSIDAVISGTLSFLAFITLYNLAGQTQ
ncbi:hypothetical protein A2714_02020 [Candidatus Woesebacteria bacterium RIFCSPHIGHO2_01_FULL_38_9]|uniref:Uncharacterized protein n=2 Tax=Candidatus Woeseibacteriota TaxID=1752722 RepID=A0A1F7Y3G4_9BACT|nr:MAG: hypothetical protein A2714_02020 [Candidatus Woesebacteria bacterium RIFCSPHIGHO2_01_FULL_38_9]OGM60175.1 MAG: hypothetical protein A3A75_05745 [Candidatus Woesebacteria bacterium RIFCSPLOWO2_01_FULL_39_10]